MPCRGRIPPRFFATAGHALAELEMSNAFSQGFDDTHRFGARHGGQGRLEAILARNGHQVMIMHRESTILTNTWPGGLRPLDLFGSKNFLRRAEFGIKGAFHRRLLSIAMQQRYVRCLGVQARLAIPRGMK